MNNQRRKSVFNDSGQVIRTKYYFGDYERISENSETKNYHYISSPTGLCAIFVTEGSGTQGQLWHTYTDHLGSLVYMVNADNSNDYREYSFDPWGNPRDAEDWTDSLSVPLFAGRGFTGHEHMEEFALINMNGRIYDPMLGRFFSPDPYVQLPGYAGSYNRYSYCLNNPLKFSDPDGEWIITLLFMLGNAYFNGVMANNMQFSPLKWEPNLKTFYAIGSGLLTGYSIGSDFEEMVEGFFVNKKFQRDVSNGMLGNYSAEELYTKNYIDVRYGDSFLGPINSNAIYNDKILYKGKIIPIRNNEYNFKLSEGIGVQSSSRVEGYLAYDGHYVTGSAQVLRNQEHLNLTYNANITLRDGEKIIDVFRLTKTNNEIFISSYYKYLGSVTFAVPKQKSSYFLDFFIGFEGYKNLSFFNGKLYNQTFLFIP